MEQIDPGTLKWLAGLLGTAILSLLGATWRTSRQSKEYEDALKDVKAIKLRLFGDKLQEKKAALDDVEEAKESASYAAKGMRLIYRAFRVPHAASEEETIAHFREVLGTTIQTGQFPVVEPPFEPTHPKVAPHPRKPIKPPIPRGEDD